MWNRHRHQVRPHNNHQNTIRTQGFCVAENFLSINKMPPDRNHKVVRREERPRSSTNDKDHQRLKVVDITAGTKLKHPKVPFPLVLPQHEFSMLLIAEKGSGKTNLICNLIVNQFKGIFCM